MKAINGEGDRKRLWGALALFVAAPLAAVTLIVFNVTRAIEFDDRASVQEKALKQIERRVRAGASGSGTSFDTSGLYLAGGSTTLARAELQKLVARLIDRSSARLIETQAGDEPADPGENRPVQLRITLDGTNESLLNFLYDLEVGLPLLTVEQINIRKLPIRNGAPETDPPLRVTLLVQGHWSGAVQ